MKGPKARNRQGKPAARRELRAGRLLATAALLFLLAGCTAPPPYRAVSPHPAARPAPPSTQVYFYPAQGQSQERQGRDHYECYQWSIRQTGWDPGQSDLPREARVRVVPMPPPGHDTATLAIAGAVLGALIGGPRHAAGGAIIGASGGAVIGAASDAARVENARRLEEAYAAQAQTPSLRQEAQAADFRRAMSACLGGRGYTVR